MFTEDQASMDTEEDLDEVEIAINQNDNQAYNKVLDWTTSDVVSVDNDVSGVAPLDITEDNDTKVIIFPYSCFTFILILYRPLTTRA